MDQEFYEQVQQCRDETGYQPTNTEIDRMIGDLAEDMEPDYEGDDYV